MINVDSTCNSYHVSVPLPPPKVAFLAMMQLAKKRRLFHLPEVQKFAKSLNRLSVVMKIQTGAQRSRTAMCGQVAFATRVVVAASHT